MHTDFQNPRWLRDLLRFIPLKSQFVLFGNVRDLQASEIAPSVVTPLPFNQSLFNSLFKAGYAYALTYTPLVGFHCLANPAQDAQETEAVMQRLGLNITEGKAAGGIDMLNHLLERLIQDKQEPIALCIDFASCLISHHDNLTPAEHSLFTRALVASHQSKARPAGEHHQPFYNTVFWIVEKETDLPDWFVINNPRIRAIPVAKPDGQVRRLLAQSLLGSLVDFNGIEEADKPQIINDFVDETEGLLLLDLTAIVQLARIEQVPAASIRDAVRRYKVGITEDPWKKIDKQKIHHAPAVISRRVKGQQHAVTHLLDIIKRAMTGVGSHKGGRPRGVLFLAGPTGVGKTELAKTVTQLLFGDESAYIRFDMSEFSAEHADQRLIGAPPGYVGYDSGGELTNAIREKPFSVVLFDEIEKAHPHLMDKFLQIIDDGVLTSGRGDRVYFSESLIIFTSNLGIYRLDTNGERVANVQPHEPFETVTRNVKNEIERHFKLVLNRPELLNRIGENIIVFDFIRPDVAEQIFEQMVDNILLGLEKQLLTISISAEAKEALKVSCLADLSNGGRGIRNQLEMHLINPLSRAIFDQDIQTNSAYQITSIQMGENTQIMLTAVGN
ncbi:MULTISPECIES: AAA family ATPase [Providencia]|uniref:AAA family ATPase n=1 Tax=Providencia TaxID=586 RepID=UPI0019816C41|nr:MULTISPECIES: AAA family ATPase [Providencia]MBN4865293.1 ATP-dependent Clp protease ATP-binding subunit [Providencia stuartii]MBN4874481.1 ATP-dependent Clp protease ATP-binding subunit [Providencia stuartii]MBN4879306.1 ATP-dependent Clp protease ATP-binding subunit [Providencia stuartii]MBN4883682.1 ATP-dependent Clp protease ATP-binding subunit [Providencia stuartii]